VAIEASKEAEKFLSRYSCADFQYTKISKEKHDKPDTQEKITWRTWTKPRDKSGIRMHYGGKSPEFLALRTIGRTPQRKDLILRRRRRLSTSG
jgi:exopolysaccharide biosynthesis protein